MACLLFFILSIFEKCKGKTRISEFSFFFFFLHICFVRVNFENNFFKCF